MTDKECVLCDSKDPSPFMEGCLEFNVNMDNHVLINFTYLDLHIAPEETMSLYARLRNEGIVLYDGRTEAGFNRIMGIQLDDTYWYLSAAADKTGLKQEELFFWELKDWNDLDDTIKQIQDQQGKRIKWEVKHD